MKYHRMARTQRQGSQLWSIAQYNSQAKCKRCTQSMQDVTKRTREGQEKTNHRQLKCDKQGQMKRHVCAGCFLMPDQRC